eukprot:TRINITY_DN591_c0_g1_i1.p1 TRINITY_DN591_c0_g1~~TRINITY_DN591_c0_g1_i1.p1  ORF type:complete len:423 (-),score=77.86 TRINITY_DN591_c0_g1_i1:113-1381(-)
MFRKVTSSFAVSRCVGPVAATRSFASSTTALNDVVIVSAVRTPVGSIMGTLADVTGPQLATIAIKGALERGKVDPATVQEVILGNVISAAQGQNPARQASLGAGLPISAPVTNINKVCASGMKAVQFAAQSIMLGHQDVIVAGGFESMSNIPYYVPNMRKGVKFGNTQLLDGLIHDGLWDVYGNVHMGNCGEVCAEKHNISRAEQDEFAITSYKRTAAATQAGLFKDEIVGVTVPQKKGGPAMITEDEEYKKVDFDKVPKLKPAFKKDGTVTAANSPSLNDGASALIIMSAAKAKELGLKPLAKIRGFADAELEPVDFTVAPAQAVPKALKMAGIDIKDVDYWEINEAFSVVGLANMRLLGISHDKLNVNGGAVAMGHPIGMSGARIVTALTHILKQKNAKIGCAAICNGGGGASAIVLERL